MLALLDCRFFSDKYHSELWQRKHDDDDGDDDDDVFSLHEFTLIAFAAGLRQDSNEGL